MHTGISPDDGDFDIDVGLRFAVDKEDYPDPTVLRQYRIMRNPQKYDII